MNFFNPPRTVEEAVESLMNSLPLKEKVAIASLNRDDLYLLYLSIGAYINQEYRLLSGNHRLIESCRAVSRRYTLTVDQCVHVIIECLWKELGNTHKMREIIRPVTN